MPFQKKNAAPPDPQQVIANPEETMTKPPEILLPETQTPPIADVPPPAAPFIDARTQMISSLKDIAMRGVILRDNFNEYKTMQPTKAPPRWPAVIDGRKIVGFYLYYGENGEGLAGNDLVGNVWTPLHSAYCAGHEELKHIATGFNAAGFYQYEDSIWGYCDREKFEEYNAARSYYKPQQILLRGMQEKFANTRGGETTERLPGAPVNDPDAVLHMQFASSPIDEISALRSTQATRSRAA